MAKKGHERNRPAPADEFTAWIANSVYDEDPDAVAKNVANILDNLKRYDPTFDPTGWTHDHVLALLDQADKVPSDKMAMSIVWSSALYLNFLAVTDRWTGTDVDIVRCVRDLTGYLDD